MKTIGVISGGLPSDPPGQGTAAESYQTNSGSNVLEISVRCSGAGDLVLLRWFSDLGVGGEWRPWKEDRPIACDGTKFSGYASATYVVANESAADWLLWDELSVVNVDTAHAQQQTIRGMF